MLNLFPVNNPRADDLLLVLGKVTRLGMEFEGKSKGILRFIRLANALRDAPELSFEEVVASLPRDMQLARTINAFPGLGLASKEDFVLLDSAREARNSIIHEGVHFPLHVRSPVIHDKLTNSLEVLRSNVRVLAAGDNLVSSWLHTIEDPDEGTPVFFMGGYVEAVERWIFASVWDLLKHPDSEVPPRQSMTGQVHENFSLLPEHLRPPGW